ncbi:MAG: sigma-70 family RNA polymerase sigma factor, partial [Anaerolineales bacterium]|nr:sigma-70 family RNA polymerase sigma factor [Anaerolineales bacterium]
MVIDFTAIFETNSGEIYSYLWRLLHDAQDAEDCLQEVFLRAFRAYGRLDRGSNYRAWLYKIATNTAFNFIKKRNSIAMRETVSDIDRLSDGDSVVNVVETRERLQTVMKVVDELPSKQRSALIMRKYHA